MAEKTAPYVKNDGSSSARETALVVNYLVRKVVEINARIEELSTTLGLSSSIVSSSEPIGPSETKVSGFRDRGAV